jgi:hypothetical protein
MPHQVKSIDTVWVDVPMRPIPERNMRRENPHWTLFEICRVTLDSGVVGLGETMVYYTWGPNTVSDAARNRVIGAGRQSTAISSTSGTASKPISRY